MSWNGVVGGDMSILILVPLHNWIGAEYHTKILTILKVFLLQLLDRHDLFTAFLTYPVP